MDHDPKLRLKAKAINLLARRDYSRQELQKKLLQTDSSEVDIDILLEELAQKGYQSDQRTKEVIIRQKIASGFGPRVIKSFFSQKGLLENELDNIPSEKNFWISIIETVCERKNRLNELKDTKKQQRLIRWLLSRGFEPSHIQDWLSLKLKSLNVNDHLECEHHYE